MPCNNNSLNRFFGSSGSVTNNCVLGSFANKENRWSDVECKKSCTYQFFPKRERHEMKVECCGVTELPFFILSSVFYDAVLRHTLNNQTPEIYNVDPITFFPTAASSDTYALGPVAGTASDYDIPAALVNVDSALHVQVPRCASDGIVIDVNQLSTFANSIYQNQITTARSVTAPGAGSAVLGIDNDLTAAGASGFTDLTVGATAASFTGVDLGYDALRLMHVPEVTVFNDSRHTVTLVDGFRGRLVNDDGTAKAGNCGNRNLCSSSKSAADRRLHYKFEGVRETISCKPRESLTVVFLPDKGQWRVKDTNSRA